MFYTGRESHPIAQPYPHRLHPPSPLHPLLTTMSFPSPCPISHLPLHSAEPRRNVGYFPVRPYAHAWGEGGGGPRRLGLPLQTPMYTSYILYIHMVTRGGYRRLGQELTQMIVGVFHLGWKLKAHASMREIWDWRIKIKIKKKASAFHDIFVLGEFRR